MHSAAQAGERSSTQAAAAHPIPRLCSRSWLSTKEFIFKHREKSKLLNPTCRKSGGGCRSKTTAEKGGRVEAGQDDASWDHSNDAPLSPSTATMATPNCGTTLPLSAQCLRGKSQPHAAPCRVIFRPPRVGTADNVAPEPRVRTTGRRKCTQ